MPAIVSEFQANPTPLRGGDWGAYLDAFADIDENGALTGPQAIGVTENAARVALIWQLFEDVEPEYIRALIEEMERRCPDDDRREGYVEAVRMLQLLLDVEAV